MQLSGYSGRQLASKWAKTAALQSHPDLKSHIPPTRRYTVDNLASMLDTHQMVVVKPVVGTGGNGVMKVERVSGGYTCSYYARKQHFGSLQALAASINRHRRGRRYLIQKGIRLATVGGRPIDYRVKYVKNDSGAWEYRAIVGRIARKGLFVTNLCRGGTMVTGAEGIRRSLSGSLVRSKKQEMRNLTVKATEVLSGLYPGIGQLGFDFGIDKNHKIWIFEVNTRPK